MFIAGIEIFFGFIAGAAILLLAITLLPVCWYILVAIFKAIIGGAIRLSNWIVRRRWWIIGTLTYCVVSALLSESNNAVTFAAGALMWVALLLAGLFRIYLISNSNRKAAEQWREHSEFDAKINDTMARSSSG